MTDNTDLVYLKTMQNFCLVINHISQVLIVLFDKRKTIAEKAIQEELLQCVDLEISLLNYLQKAAGKKAHLFEEADLMILIQINIQFSEVLKAFIKAAEYDLNYLEQYFEHDFWLMLTKNRYAEQLSHFYEKIKLMSTICS